MFEGQWRPKQAIQFEGIGPVPPLGGGVTSLTFVGAMTADSSDCNLPITAIVGDLAIMFDVAVSFGGIPTLVTPSGWTLATPSTTFDGTLDTRIAISYRVLTSGEISSPEKEGMSGDGMFKIILVFRPNSPISTVTPGSWNSATVTGNPTSQTVTASGQPVPLVVFGMAGSGGGGANFSTESPSFDDIIEVDDEYLIAGYKIYNSTPANHTVDMDDLFFYSNSLSSGYIRVS